MKTLLKGFLFLVFVLGAIRADAQDQTVALSGFRAVETADETVDCTTFKAADAPALIKKALNISALESERYYVIHIVQLGDTASNILCNNWFIYKEEWATKTGALEWIRDPQRGEHFTDSRIFGSNKVSLVYAYLNLRGFSKTDVPADEPDALRFWESMPAPAAGGRVRPSLGSVRCFFRTVEEQNAEETLPKGATDDLEKQRIARIEALKQLSDVACNSRAQYRSPESDRRSPAVATAAAERFLLQQDMSDLNVAVVSDRGLGFVCSPFRERFICLETPYSQYLKISYQIKISKKTPRPISDLEAVLSFIGTLQGKIETLRVGTLPLNGFGGGDLGVRYQTSDIDLQATVKSSAAEDPLEVGKLKIDNEGRSHWGINFAAPLTKLDELKYEQQGTGPNLFVPKTVPKQSVYAGVTIFPWSIDTKKTYFRFVPGFMAALAIEGKALNHQLYAVSLGLWKVDVFWGHKVTRVELPLAAGATKPSYDISSRSTFGVSLPVRTVLDLFTKEKKDNTTTSGKEAN